MQQRQIKIKAKEHNENKMGFRVGDLEKKNGGGQIYD